jgi:hypothetical protein
MGEQRYEIRPLGPWIGPKTAIPASPAVFRAPWPDTLALLGRETDLLGARLVVVQVDVTEGEIRRDGMLRAGARVGFWGVRVSFDSRHGPLTYATDAYAGWKANVRAIALALEALRAVDRYGVSRTGEQYRGWRAITAGPAPAGRMSRDEAARFLAENGDVDLADVLTDPGARNRAYKRVAARWHPDRTDGCRELFERANAARAVLDGAW